MTPQYQPAAPQYQPAASQCEPAASQCQPASQWLRARTRREHAAAEAGLDLRRLRAPADLARLLRAWVAVWQEISCAAGGPGVAPVAGPELAIPAAQALDWLADDLAQLDTELPRHPLDRSPTLPAVSRRPGVPGGSVTGLLSEPARVWGAAYVLRGSRLGGQFLAPAVAAAVGVAPRCGTAFLRSAGTDTGADWVAFRRRLDSAVRTADELAAARAAASWLFGWVGVELAAGLAGAPVAGTPAQVA